MAKAQTAAARFMTEVAPPQVVSVMRRGKVARSLDTIVEDDREQLMAYNDGASSADNGFAAAWSGSSSRAQARECSGGLMRELSRYFASDAADRGQPGGGWDWEKESGHKLGHRRVVQELHARSRIEQ
ncbi:hypothetical protein U9M48_025619 [Paspalum notatum var. saurae]|uniref:Uncharacterized protein n=1 Tax=Paspalum notatum var. saurae TaxID=547442 RepID=A0AAQ3TTL1_PASNO